MNHRSKFEKISRILVLLNFVIIFTLYIYTGLQTEGETTCLSAGCINNSKRSNVMIYAKFGYGILNITLAVIFAIMLFRYNKTHAMINPNMKRLATNFVKS
jgi:hypothetical protein